MLNFNEYEKFKTFKKNCQLSLDKKILRSEKLKIKRTNLIKSAILKPNFARFFESQYSKHQKYLAKKEKVYKRIRINNIRIRIKILKCDKNMPRKEKFEEYGLKTKTTTIRIPNLENTDKEKELRKAIDIFVLDFINLKTNTNTQILKNGILELNKLMSIVKPKIPSNIDINKIREGVKLCHTI